MDTDVLLTAREFTGHVVWARQLGTDGPDVPVSIEPAPGGVQLTYLSEGAAVRVLFDRDGASLVLSNAR